MKKILISLLLLTISVDRLLASTIGIPPSGAFYKACSTSGNFLVGPESQNDSLTVLRGLVVPLTIECSGVIYAAMSSWHNSNSGHEGLPLGESMVIGSLFTLPGAALLVQNPKSKAGWLYLFSGALCMTYVFLKPYTDDKAVKGFVYFEIPRVFGFIKAYNNYQKWKRR
ncbi:MAG: hypothetical protein JNL74_05230 [Fibrobacteres bacterium]|jgi:hypothetical protein|nr:hypothetical protein [Fibrobacterota bacterium]